MFPVLLWEVMIIMIMLIIIIIDFVFIIFVIIIVLSQYIIWKVDLTESCVNKKMNLSIF